MASHSLYLTLWEAIPCKSTFTFTRKTLLSIDSPFIAQIVVLPLFFLLRYKKKINKSSARMINAISRYNHQLVPLMVTLFHLIL